MPENAPPSSAGPDLYRELCSRFGNEAISNDTAAFTIAGHAPACAAFPSTVAQVGELMAFARARNLGVIPVGNAVHLQTGWPPIRYDIALSLRRLARIIAHEAADMTVTVEAGIPLGALNGALASSRQWLPLDPPLPEKVTIGGAIAADLNGPLRLSQGKVRDLLIGVTVVLADGSVVKGGGRVVKNVAGYDLCKLFTGSRGTLGVIVEATFKIRPRPECERVLWIETPSLEAAAKMGLALLDSEMVPLFVEVLDGNAVLEARVAPRGTAPSESSIDATGAAGSPDCSADGQPCAVVIGLGGIEEELDAQQEVVRRHHGEGLVVCTDTEANRLTQQVRDFHWTEPATLTACVSALPTRLAELLPSIGWEAATRGLEAAVIAHAGNGVARVRVRGDSEMQAILFAEWLRITARERGGWAVFDSVADNLCGRVDPFGNATPAVLLMEGIKRQLDPDSILSPGRFVGGI